MKPVRCAIYTRKSSEEGLEQGFNSLDAQREACAAYILSQASEGWSALPDIYDDGGISGGTLERPALQRLLGDIAAGRIDIIVVYKVDRLTRSLLDFARLVEAFDKAGVSFVSITQSFNTTTSMGRLTLNMLLSFAQFEREVTAERIRDKIAASKARGMWMGGIPPLGYRADGRSLAIIEEHADLVREIYKRYLAIGNVRLLADQLQRDGVTSPQRTTTTGKSIGGGPFTRGQLYLMLGCRTYLGEVVHGDKVYPGLHAPIIDRDTWDYVQAKRADNHRGQRSGANARNTSLLAGLLTDARGQPLIATHATKGSVRYRYYVSRDLHHGHAEEGWRIPAAEIEAVVTTRLAQAFDDPLGLMAEARLSLEVHDIAGLESTAQDAAHRLRRKDRDLVRMLIRDVKIASSGIAIMCNTSAIASALGGQPQADTTDMVTFTSDVKLTRSGMAVRLVHDSGARASSEADPALVRLIVQAHRYWRILRSEPIDLKRLAAREQVSASWLSRVLRLAFLSPHVTEAILAGKQSARFGGLALVGTDAVDPRWEAQGRVYLLSG